MLTSSKVNFQKRTTKSCFNFVISSLGAGCPTVQSPRSWCNASRMLDGESVLFPKNLPLQRSNKADGKGNQWSDKSLSFCIPYLHSFLAWGSRSENASLNDHNMLALMHKCPDNNIADAAIKAFSRHLWYLSENLVLLALFDDRVVNTTKQAMVDNRRW